MEAVDPFVFYLAIFVLSLAAIALDLLLPGK